MRSAERTEQHGGSVILYDPGLADAVDERWFDRLHWDGAAAAPGYAGGRGATLFIHCGAHDCVLRHYHRGGRIASVASDGFFWLGEPRTRSFREWRLLARMTAAGLPVPRPFAARYVRRGLVYRADLMTVLIPEIAPLSTVLGRGGAGADLWERVGACIARFHAAGFCHADLTAHNLQVSSAGEVFLLDFDRGSERDARGSWCAGNLARLRRSLAKISGEGDYHFDEGQWAALMRGYAPAVSR
ncbi:MAG: 3-deoxy-D-manno-octulosonic acid kinase [Gammaproteobacteria bacterium]|nr:3-deoxy-D-manno-octulosonic acid kinase [Gammaproteobacteria bacterium]